MASRTNKMGIMKQKKQAEKQKKLIGENNKTNLQGQKREYINPKGNVYNWFFRNGKLICDNTSAREDPDGYRIVRQPNSGQINFIYKGNESWSYRRYIKKNRKYR